MKFCIKNRKKSYIHFMKTNLHRLQLQRLPGGSYISFKDWSFGLSRCIESCRRPPDPPSSFSSWALLFSPWFSYLSIVSNVSDNILSILKNLEYHRYSFNTVLFNYTCRSYLWCKWNIRFVLFVLLISTNPPCGL